MSDRFNDSKFDRILNKCCKVLVCCSDLKIKKLAFTGIYWHDVLACTGVCTVVVCPDPRSEAVLPVLPE